MITIDSIERSINVSIEQIDNKISQSEKYSILLRYIDLINEDYKNILKIPEDVFVDLSLFCTPKDFNYLRIYRIYLKNENLTFPEDSKNYLNEIINNIKSKLIEINDVDTLNDEKQKLISTSRCLQDSKIDEYNIEFLVEYLKSINSDPKEIIELLISLASNSITTFDDLTEDDYLEIPETNLNEEEVRELFAQYGYDIDDFRNEPKSELLKYGNLENIREILKVFNIYGVNLNKIKNDKKLLTLRSKQLQMIFVYSTGKLVEEIFELYTEISEDVEIFDFDIILSRPSRFLLKKKRLELLNKGGNNTSSEITGCHQDFIKNVNLFKSKFKQIGKEDLFKERFDKCDSIFDISNETICQIIKVYDLYGISEECYLDSLSGFNSIQQADTLDIVIENGCLDYIKQNMSLMMKKIDDDMFKRIVIARQNGVPFEILFAKRDKETLFGTRKAYNLNSSFIKNLIEKNNWSLETYKKPEIFDDFESIISTRDNSSIDLAKVDILNPEYDSKIKILDKKYFNSENPLEYVIAGVVISRLKVLRLYNSLKMSGVEDSIESILYLITRNSYLTQEQFENIKKDIYELYNVKENQI